MTRPSSTRYLPLEMTRRFSAWPRLCVLLAMSVCLVLSSACVQKYGGETFLISVDNDGNALDLPCGYPVVSADGGKIAFWSWTEGVADQIIVRNRALKRTSVVCPSVYPYSASGVADMSSDGRHVVCVYEPPERQSEDHQVLVVGTEDGSVETASLNSSGDESDGGGFEPSISGDGHILAFTSMASNLVLQGSNDKAQVFVRDMKEGTTTCVSTAPNGELGDGNSWSPAMSGDGRYVAFVSTSSNLVDGYLRCDSDADESYDDVCADIFVHDRKTGSTTLVSVLTDGTRGDGNSLFPSISGDGRFVAFVSGSRSFLAQTHDAAWGFFVRDRESGVTTRVGLEPRGIWMDSVGGAAEALSMGMWGPEISGGGNWVTFVEGLDVVVSKVDGSDREMVSVSSAGEAGGGDEPSISHDGRCIAFSSFSSSLAPGGDTSHGAQVYLRERPTESRVIPIEGYVAVIAVAIAGVAAAIVAFRRGGHRVST